MREKMKHNFRTIAFCLALITSLLCVAVIPAEQVGGRTRNSTTTEKVVYRQNDSPRKDKPEVIIEAPSSVKVGDMIIVDLNKSIGDGFDMIIRPKPPQVRIFDGGKVVVTATGYKTVEYLFIVSCALNGESDVKVHIVKVLGLQPVIPTNPGDNVAEKVISWCESVDSPTLRDDALKLAQSFASLAVVIENGTFQTPKEIVSATKTSNRDALGTNLDHWVPLLDGLMNELKAMAKIGLLPDAFAHGPVWRSVSKGLKAYAENLAG